MKTTLLVLLALTQFKVSAQDSSLRIAFHDAVYLHKLYIANNDTLIINNDTKKVLSYYFGKDSNRLSTAVFTNPFLKLYFLNPAGASAAAGSTFSTNAVRNLSTFFSRVGNTNITAVADGVAKFLVNRTKEELSVAFFEQLKQDFQDEKYSDLRILFPQTASKLDLIDEKIYQFSAYLTDLRDAFILDLNNIPSTALVVVNQPKYNQYFSQHPTLKRAFQVGFFISNSLLVNKNKLNDIVKSLIEDTITVNRYFPADSTDFDKTVNASFKTLQLVSNSIRSGDASQYWLSPDSLGMLLNDTITFRIYLGLIYQQAKTENIVFAPNEKLTDLLANASNKIDTLQKSIFNFYTELNAFDNYRRQYIDIQNGLQKDSLSTYYYGLYNTSLNILKAGLKLPNSWGKTKVALIDSIIPALHDAGEIYMYTSQKKYSMAVLSLTKLYTDVIDLNGENDKFKKSRVLITRLSTYSSFMAQVANAKSSDAVDSVIAATVLPTGSSYIKKHSIFNLALQAYTGLYGGAQRQATDTKYVAAAGVYAPIGIAASWGFGSHKSTVKNPGSFSFFASLVDLGPLVSFRFSNYNDTIANDVQVRLSQIVSPGMHAVIGVPKLPISIGGGFNWAPLLTQVEKDQIHVDTKSALRWQVFVAVDIPLLNFYNKPR